MVNNINVVDSDLFFAEHKTNKEENGAIERGIDSKDSEENSTPNNFSDNEEQAVSTGQTDTEMQESEVEVVESKNPLDKFNSKELESERNELIETTEVSAGNQFDNSDADGGIRDFFVRNSLIIVIAGLVLGAFIVLVISFLVQKRRRSGEIKRTEMPYGSDSKEKSIVKVVPAVKGAGVKVTSIHGVGARSSQQDSFGISDVDSLELIKKKGILSVVADGMGGLSDGDKISQLVVITMLQGFDIADGSEDGNDLLVKLLDDANEAVNAELGTSKQGQCGSTLVAVLVKGKYMYFVSVGDSHIYLYHEGNLKQINQDHNYAAELDEMAKNGEISFEQAAQNPKRAALTSYIGMGTLDYVDNNEEAIKLISGDRILLMSDGVYGTVGDENLRNAMTVPLEKSTKMIYEIICAENRPNQDNFTCILMEIL